MATTSVGLGSFIPNAAGLPKVLTMNPTQLAQAAAEKAAQQQQAQQLVTKPLDSPHDGDSDDTVNPSETVNLTV